MALSFPFRPALAAVSLALAGLLTAEAAWACSTSVGRGWARGGGSGTITMAKGGKACGSQVWVDPGARLPVTRLSVTSQPANGRVAIQGNTFSYTPRTGFSGQDSFALSGSGKAATGEQANLTGTISVTVQ